MFDELTNQFEDAVKAFKGEAKISEENVDEAIKQVRQIASLRLKELKNKNF